MMILQVRDQPDNGFEHLVSLTFPKMPFTGVIISQEILPQIFALPGNFQFSATLSMLELCFLLFLS